MIVRNNVRLGAAMRFAWKNILFVAGYSVLVVLVYQAGVVEIAIPLAIPAMLGTALSILLGFRTNSAYARWWEARKIWGAIVNDSRTFARQVTTLFMLPEAAIGQDMLKLQRELVYRQIGWNYCLTRSLRRQDPYAELHAVILADEVEALQSQDSLTNALLQMQACRLTDAYRSGYIDTLRLLRIQDTLVRLCDHMGKCERIKNTVFPVHYRFLVSLIIWLFALLLPLGLVANLGWLTAPLSFLICVVFRLIAVTSDAMQDPFENTLTDTPMLALSRTIEINLRQQLGEMELPEKIQPEDGVLM